MDEGMGCRATHELRRLPAVTMAHLLCAIALSAAPSAALSQAVPLPLPKYYQETGASPFRDHVTTNLDETVDPFTGKLQLHHVDDVVPGQGGFALRLSRSYTSPGTGYGTISDTLSYNRTPNVGVGWSLLLGGRLYSDNACMAPGRNLMVLETPDGGRQALVRTSIGSTEFVSASRWRALCTQQSVDGTTVVEVISPAGLRIRMARPIAEAIPNTIQAVSFLYPTSITDPNGNTATLTYGTRGAPAVRVLDSVSTSDGRLFTFSYSQQGRTWLLDSVSAPSGTWTFGYSLALADAQGFGVSYQMTRATPPSGGSWSYAYNACTATGPGACAMSRVTHPSGGSLSYTYGSVNFNDGTGAQSVVATKTGASGTWSFTYTPGSQTTNDTTTVATPVGTLTYRHIGYGNIGFGTSWKAGLLVSKQIGSAQTETYDWDRQQISTLPTDRGYGVHDGGTYAPVLRSKSISRSGATYSTAFSDWDAHGNPQTIVESGQRSRTISRSYCTNGALGVLHVPGSESWGSVSITRTFDSRCNLLSESRNGVVTSFGVSASGNVTSRTDANNKTTHYSGHALGIAQTTSRPDGSSVQRSVSAAGNVTEETDGAGNNHRFSFDGIRRLTTWNPPIGASLTINWAGSSSWSSTRSTLTQSATFDALGRPSSATRATIMTDFDYDVLGRKTFESLPGSLQGTVLSRDILGRVTRMTHADGKYRTFGFSGNTVTATDERGNQTTHRYESYGDPDQRFLVGIDLPSGRSITMGRNSLGQLTSATQNGITRTYTYNARYFLTSIDDPETGTTTFGRDGVGNMTSMTIGGRTTTYAYDAMNRLIRITYPGNKVVDFTYLGSGKVRTVTNSVASWTYDYDANGNLLEEGLVVDGRTYRTTYTYTPIDALDTMTYANGLGTVDYSANSLGRPTKAGPYVTGVTHFDSGNLRSITYANGVVMNYTETARHWPSGVTATRGARFVDKSYGFDDAGNITSIDDGIALTNSLTLGYNAVNELTSASGPWGSGAIDYGSTGNITRYAFGGQSRTYGYASGNRLTSFAGRSFDYDGYGNVTGDGLHTYVYDDASNLVCVDCAAQSKIEYAYDGNNRRVWRMQNGVKTYYVHSSNGELLVEHTPASGITVQHAYLKGQRVATTTTTQ